MGEAVIIYSVCLVVTVIVIAAIVVTKLEKKDAETEREQE
jgi:hypothetical protein